MKGLVEYINENSREEFISIFIEALNDDNEMTLQECYEELFDQMFSVNEGFFSNLGKKLANLGSKAASAGEKLDDKINQASDLAQKAIEKAKKKAGDAWDSVKTTYTSMVLAVDGAIQSTKESTAQLCKQAKMKVEDFEAKLGQIYSNAIASSKELAEKMTEWASDKTKGAQTFAAINTLVMGAMLAKKAGVDSGMALEILTAAGFK